MYSDRDDLAAGFPHSDIRGSKLTRSSPRLFAACHVLRRLLAPRHPPNALLTLDQLTHGQTSDVALIIYPCKRCINLFPRTHNQLIFLTEEFSDVICHFFTISKTIIHCDEHAAKLVSFKLG